MTAKRKNTLVNGVRIFDAPKRIDSMTLRQQFGEFLADIEDENPKLIFNAVGIKKPLDSSTLNEIAYYCHKAVQERGGQMVIAGGGRGICNLLILSRLALVYPLYADVQEALGSFLLLEKGPNQLDILDERSEATMTDSSSYLPSNGLDLCSLVSKAAETFIAKRQMDIGCLRNLKKRCEQDKQKLTSLPATQPVATPATVSELYIKRKVGREQEPAQFFGYHENDNHLPKNLVLNLLELGIIEVQRQIEDWEARIREATRIYEKSSDLSVSDLGKLSTLLDVDVRSLLAHSPNWVRIDRR